MQTQSEDPYQRKQKFVRVLTNHRNWSCVINLFVSYELQHIAGRLLIVEIAINLKKSNLVHSMIFKFNRG